MDRLKAVAASFLLLGVALWLGGCSQDKHTFTSTPDLPLTLTLTTYDHVVWKKDVPVYHKLVVDFDRPIEFEPIFANQQPATQMVWRVYKESTMWDNFEPIEEGELSLPGSRLKMTVTYRPAPEFPPDFKLPGTKDGEAIQPAPDTAPPVPEKNAPPKLNVDDIVPPAADDAAEPAAPATPAPEAAKPEAAPAPAPAPAEMTPAQPDAAKPAPAPAPAPAAPPADLDIPEK